MGRADRIISNSVNIFAIESLNRLVNVLMMVYAARMLGVKHFGVFMLVGAVIGFFNIFGSTGIHPVAIREIARNKDKAGLYLNNIIGLRLVMAIIIYSALVIFVIFNDYDREIRPLFYLMGLTIFLNVFSGTFAILYTALEKRKVLFLYSVGISFLTAFVSILLLYLGYSVQALILTDLFFGLISVLICGWHIWTRISPFRIEMNRSIWHRILVESFPFALHGLSNIVIQRNSVLLLSMLRGPVNSIFAIGYYAPVNRALNVIMKFPQAMRIALLPVLSEDTGSHVFVRKVVEDSTRYLLLFLSFPVILITNFFSEPLVSLILGDEYLLAAPVLQILGWAFALKAINAPIQSVLVSSGHLYRYLPFQAGTAVLCVLLNIMLIPRYSYTGAAVAELITAIAATLGRHYFVRTIYGMNPDEQKTLSKVFLTIVASFLSVYFLYHLCNVPMVLSIPAGLAIYGAMIYFFGILAIKELTTLFQGVLKNIPLRT